MLAADVRWPANGRAAWIRIEWVNRSAQRVDRQRRGNVRGTRQLFGGRERKREDRRRRLRAVDQREPFFRPQTDCLQARPRQRLGAWHDVQPRRTRRRGSKSPIGFSALCALSAVIVVIKRFALTDQHEREVGERREVAAGADRSARGHVGIDAGVQERDQRIERVEADA